MKMKLFKKSILAYLSFFTLGLIYCLAQKTTRDPLLARNLIEGLVYMIGGSIWFALPGMINYWMNYKAGYVRWGRVGIVTTATTGLLCYIFLGHLPVNLFLISMAIMATPTAIVQFIGLCLMMRLRVTAPEPVTEIEAEVVTDPGELERFVKGLGSK